MERYTSRLPQENADAYPLKFALEAVHSKKDQILEAGCGNGRILRFFKDCGYEIQGFDYIDGATRLFSTPIQSLRFGPMILQVFHTKRTL